MCTGMEAALLSAAVSGTGALLQANAAEDAEQNRLRIIRQAEEESANKNQQKNALLETFAADNYNPTRRLENYQNKQTELEGQLLDSVAEINQGGGDQLDTAAEGRLSEDYLQSKAQATSDSAKRLTDRARLMAKRGALTNLFADDQMGAGQLNSDVAGIQSSINRTNRYANSSLNRVDDNGSLLGGVMMGVAPAAGMLARS